MTATLARNLGSFLVRDLICVFIIRKHRCGTCNQPRRCLLAPPSIHRRLFPCIASRFLTTSWNKHTRRGRISCAVASTCASRELPAPPHLDHHGERRDRPQSRTACRRSEGVRSVRTSNAALYPCACANRCSSLPTSTFPKNFFCALCSQLAIDSFKLLCCNKVICPSCQSSRASTTAPVMS